MASDPHAPRPGAAHASTTTFHIQVPWLRQGGPIVQETFTQHLESHIPCLTPSGLLQVCIKWPWVDHALKIDDNSS